MSNNYNPGSLQTLLAEAFRPSRKPTVGYLMKVCGACEKFPCGASIECEELGDELERRGALSFSGKST